MRQRRFPLAPTSPLAVESNELRRRDVDKGNNGRRETRSSCVGDGDELLYPGYLHGAWYGVSERERTA